MAKTIPSKEIIQALQLGGATYHCERCEAQMFVATASGLCPVCWNNRRPLSIDELLSDVLDEELPEIAVCGELDAIPERIQPLLGDADPYEDSFAEFFGPDPDSDF